MLDHVDAHARDDYIKIYAIKCGKNEGGYRPEHHAKLNTGSCNYFGGSDTSLDQVLIPDGTFIIISFYPLLGTEIIRQKLSIIAVPP